MYKVKAELLSDDLIIIDQYAAILILNSGLSPIVVNNGSINIDVPNENSKLQIEVFGYVPKVVSAKEINSVGTVYLTEMIVIKTKPKESDNTLLYILGAIGVTGILYYATQNPTPKTVKIS